MYSEASNHFASLQLSHEKSKRECVCFQKTHLRTFLGVDEAPVEAGTEVRGRSSLPLVDFRLLEEGFHLWIQVGKFRSDC